MDRIIPKRKGRPPGHGAARGGKLEPLYRVWAGMKARCHDPEAKYYGARGIGVCDEWLNDYAVFRTWALANGYQTGLQIDRKDNDGPYSPDNCRWVTGRQNQNNRSTTIFVEYMGERIAIADLARRFGLNRSGLTHRIFRYGMSVEEAVSKPRRHKGKQKGVIKEEKA